VISVLSSLIASECLADEAGVIVRNPGRALFSPPEERERLRTLGSPSVQLPELFAVLTLLSDVPGPFEYRLSCAFLSPEGEIAGPMQTSTFRWHEQQRIERLSIKLAGQVEFFEEGGIYRLLFLCDGSPLCEIPLPIFWSDQVRDADLLDPSSSR
jgi:hypothetical protein